MNNEFLDVAIQAALRGGQVLTSYYGKLSEIKSKSHPGDLVTIADKESEERIIEHILGRFPKHAILGEESGMHKASSEFLWAIDPLDGTTNYAHAFPIFAVSIALLFQGNPIVGIVFNPISNHLYAAARGMGATCNNQPLYVSKVKTIEQSLLATGFPYSRNDTTDNNYEEFCRLTNLSQGVRRCGAASLDLAFVAQGCFDGYWENKLHAWDVAAGALLIEEAGGKVTSYDKSPLDYMKPKILATNGHIHDLLSKAICKHER